MDPIYYQVNQTKLTDVTQKTSDNLRLQSNKEARRKSQATEVEKSAVSTDTSSMSDDMLGNMDPDDYGGSGAKKFAQMWKEQLEEEKKEKEEPEREPDEEDKEEQEPEDQSAPNKAEADIEALASEAPASEVPVNPVSAPPTSDRSVANSAAAAAEPAAAKDTGSTTTAQASPADQRPAPSSPEKEAQPSTAAAEKFDRQKEKVTPPTGPPPSNAQKKSSLGSLLDFSSGFLIAEEAVWDPTAPEVEAVAEVVAEEPLAEEISILLERLVRGDSSQPSYRKLNQLLSRFGRRVLQLCVEAQAKVYLLPPGERLQAHPQLAHCGFTDLEGAAYLPQQRLCLVEDACLAQPPHGFHPVFYYFAHLYDHALGGESFASLKSAAVKASYLACLEGDHRFGDLMAAHSPAHYFAQAVESYLAENDCFEPLWTRHDLYDFDRSIYNYIEYLLK